MKITPIRRKHDDPQCVPFRPEGKGVTGGEIRDKDKEVMKAMNVVLVFSYLFLGVAIFLGGFIIGRYM